MDVKPFDLNNLPPQIYSTVRSAPEGSLIRCHLGDQPIVGLRFNSAPIGQQMVPGIIAFEGEHLGEFISHDQLQGHGAVDVRGRVELRVDLKPFGPVSTPKKGYLYRDEKTGAVWLYANIPDSVAWISIQPADVFGQILHGIHYNETMELGPLVVEPADDSEP